MVEGYRPMTNSSGDIEQQADVANMPFLGPKELMAQGRQVPGIQAIIGEGDVVLETYPENGEPKIVRRTLNNGQTCDMIMPRPGDCIAQPKIKYIQPATNKNLETH